MFVKFDWKAMLLVRTENYGEKDNMVNIRFTLDPLESVHGYSK
jgi:hypothetical protein